MSESRRIERHRGRSAFHDITVEEHDGLLEMRFSGRSQGATDAATRLELGVPVLGYLQVPFALARPPRRVLVVGLGGGVLPRRLLHDYPDVVVDVAEIDPEVARLCAEHFGLPDDPRLRVILEGGRQVIEAAAEPYDIIIVDAFFVHPTAGYATPFELVTEEFFALAAEHLSAHGVLAFNIVGALIGPGSGPLHRLFRGMTDRFASAHLFAVSAARSKVAWRSNYVAVGTMQPLSADELRERIRSADVPVEGFSAFADDLLDRPFGFRGVRAYRDSEMPPTGLMQG